MNTYSLFYKFLFLAHAFSGFKNNGSIMNMYILFRMGETHTIFFPFMHREEIK